MFYMKSKYLNMLIILSVVKAFRHDSGMSAALDYLSMFMRPKKGFHCSGSIDNFDDLAI